MIGAACEETAKGTDRVYYRAVLDLGFLPGLVCRIVGNTSRAEDAPTHLVFYSPIEGQKVGALWPYGDAPYLIGHIDLAAFGKVRLKGGIEIDFRLAGERIGVRLSAVSERRSEKSPTHWLWRLRPRRKSAVAAPAAAKASQAMVPDIGTLLDGGEEIEDEESFDEEEA